ncbi:EAL domain-containing protein [Thiobacillus sp.]|uniref:putative bifunctional diguanylate cyclase/phosphodiesterase n=1 Tax=Thiobacillus sp. TaxID=924 RepID=UPI0025F96839|nr:EAL domain-containing protein [Thiobacillus sp.]MBT9538941.1 EAL domain-containing protein [Thiobacillus sp.]
MTPDRPHPSRFTRELWLSLAALVAVALAFAVYVRAEKQIDRAHESRLQSFLLADELRQSSDDLTRMVRTYVATSDPIYKQQYEEVLAIRDGKLPRPPNYQNIYWDLILPGQPRERATGPSVSLLQRMRQAGFTAEEFALLEQAKAHSDALTRTEYAAMDLIESAAPVTGAVRNRATLMLHDSSYHQAKRAIMQPIDAFYTRVETRTRATVEGRETIATLFRALFVGLVLVLLLTLWRAYRTLKTTLGDSAGALYERIARLGSGDISSAIPVAPGMENSVMGWLSETQNKLSRIETEREKMANEIRQQRDLFISGAVVLFKWRNAPGWPVEIVSPNVEKLLGYPADDFLSGRIGYSALVHPDDIERVMLEINAASEAHVINVEHEPYRITRRDGSVVWLLDHSLVIRDSQGQVTHYLGHLLDITASRQAEEHIQYLANFDVLTGLPNRTQLDDHVKYAISVAKRRNGRLALMFIDLDHFKDINDTLGHSIGDALLIELAKRLFTVLREEDVVSRSGGDEFFVMLPDQDERSAAHVAQKLLDAISVPYVVDHHDLCVTASIGIALFPGDGEDLASLSQRADTAMYRAKQEGRNSYRFFTTEMQARSARHLQLGNALRHALERQEFSVQYQPQLTLEDGCVVGAEALLRWQHPELGQVSPAEFIPVAEDNGFILHIGEWVLRHAVQQAKTWLEAGLPPLVMAVNLSAVQFRHPTLPDLVARILDEAGLPPEYLELELTESVAMHDPQGAIAVMNKLHERGVRMSIDDFGTGYSSLGYLKKFNVYKLKIDQSFVRDIRTDPEDKAIVSAIIQMAKSLGLATIAEGVETEGQLDFLREQGCDEVQGYYYSKPLSPDAFAVFAQATRQRS